MRISPRGQPGDFGWSSASALQLLAWLQKALAAEVLGGGKNFRRTCHKIPFRIAILKIGGGERGMLPQTRCR